MNRLSRFFTPLFVVALMLGMSGCGAGEPGKQNVSTAPATGQPANPRVLIETSKGKITVELFAGNAPRSTANFLDYVRQGFYDGTIFHRVIPGFMIQGGGMTPDMSEIPNGEPIPNEADNGLKNLRGTLAMARTGDPHSATSQFFINVVDNGYRLDYSVPQTGGGYAVFGKVKDDQSMKVVDIIKETPTTGREGSTPTKTVKITKATIISE